MELMVQVGHPKILRASLRDFKTIKDTFKSLYRAEEESSFLFWNNIPIRLRYREDLSINFDNILAMVWLLRDRSEGETIVTLKNQILQAQFELRWHKDVLQVDGRFVERSHVYKSFCDRLNCVSRIKISKDLFLKEWHTLLHQIVLSLEAGNIEIEEGTERRKLEMLRRVDQAIDGFGVLYDRFAVR